MLSCALMKTFSAVSAFRARPITALAVLLAIAAFSNAALVGCGSKSESTTTNDTQTPPATTPATTTPDATTPVPAGDLGAQVYSQRCALCHGPAGHGDGPAAASLNPKPRNHTDGSYMNGRTDDQLLLVIRNGKGAMPAWGSVLSDDEIRAVLKHVRTLAVPPYKGTS